MSALGSLCRILVNDEITNVNILWWSKNKSLEMSALEAMDSL